MKMTPLSGQLNTPVQRSRRQAYFHGKYHRELILVGLVVVIVMWLTAAGR